MRRVRYSRKLASLLSLIGKQGPEPLKGYQGVADLFLPCLVDDCVQRLHLSEHFFFVLGLKSAVGHLFDCAPKVWIFVGEPQAA
ncbi:hypothetical protein PHO31112_00816 [Pandoraea horticolens]|uniref:Uncharacterized protein n=1 Tax=Pandoraea horticolens TaxID=2508298 RepID=A0A5E4SHP4_9BURK|nr:hypothetical protein PHO31112_00816 [Pandoraea horticolens]